MARAPVYQLDGAGPDGFFDHFRHGFLAPQSRAICRAVAEVGSHAPLALGKQGHELAVDGIKNRVRSVVADGHVAQQDAGHQALGRVGLDVEPRQLADRREPAIGPDDQPGLNLLAATVELDRRARRRTKLQVAQRPAAQDRGSGIAGRCEQQLLHRRVREGQFRRAAGGRGRQVSMFDEHRTQVRVDPRQRVAERIGHQVVQAQGAHFGDAPGGHRFAAHAIAKGALLFHHHHAQAAQRHRPGQRRPGQAAADHQDVTAFEGIAGQFARLDFE